MFRPWRYTLYAAGFTSFDDAMRASSSGVIVTLRILPALDQSDSSPSPDALYDNLQNQFLNYQNSSLSSGIWTSKINTSVPLTKASVNVQLCEDSSFRVTCVSKSDTKLYVYIGIGSGAAVLLVGLWWCWRRKRKRANNVTATAKVSPKLNVLVAPIH